MIWLPEYVLSVHASLMQLGQYLVANTIVTNLGHEAGCQAKLGCCRCLISRVATTLCLSALMHLSCYLGGLCLSHESKVFFWNWQAATSTTI